MHKQLQRHERYMKAQLHLFASLSSADQSKLRVYHQSRVQDFQHERLIHLLVTFFFGWLILFSTAGLFALIGNLNNPIITLSGLVLIVLLLITEVFYVIHYYRLENGVQRLYAITRKLNEREDVHVKK